MFITRETDYAIRIIRALSDGSQLSLKDICSKEQVPNAYSYKILKKLESAAVVAISRGPSGGYRLIRPAEELSLYDVYGIIEGALCINECLQEGSDCPMLKEYGYCSVHKELISLQQTLAFELQKKSLAEIFASQEEPI